MMDKPTLVIGNKNYSSWSLRPWLILKQCGIRFEEVKIPLYLSDSTRTLELWSPSGLVPVLKDGDLTVWDSLAICEYLNEKYPQYRLWPEERRARATARSMSAEMHSGFTALRQAMPMNCRGHFPGKGITPESRKDIERIVGMWQECRAKHSRTGEFLFGHFTIADAMFAPVVLRFQIYDVQVDGPAKAYANKILSLAAIHEWVEEAKRETERIDQFEPYR